MKSATPRAIVATDRQRWTCLVLDADAEPKSFITLNIEEGLKVESLPAALFNQRWQALPDYPAERAARLYAGYARHIGATEEAMTALGRLTTTTEDDVMTATTKRNAAPAVKKPAKNAAVKNEGETLKAGLRTGTKKEDLPTGGRSTVRKAPAAKKAAAPKKAATKKPAAKKAAAPKKTAPAKSGPTTETARKPGSGARIRELLQQGKDTDHILSVIHKEFPGSKAGPSDVSWNKTKLRKEGIEV